MLRSAGASENLFVVTVIFIFWRGGKGLKQGFEAEEVIHTLGLYAKPTHKLFLFFIC